MHSRRDGSSAEVVQHALAYADALYNFARWLCGDALEAEDLVQETYTHALAAAHQFKPGTNLKAWLFRILRNAHLDRRRRARHDPTQLRQDVDADAIDPVPQFSANTLEYEQLHALVASELAAAVQGLPEPFRTAIVLDLEGLAEAEVAEVMGCAAGTVKSRLSRARAELRSRLRAYRT